MSIEDMRTYFALLKDGRAAADQQLASGTKGMTHFVAAVVYFFAGISVEKGAQTTLYLATSPQVEGVSGKYFVNKQEKKSTRSSYDQALGQRLWKVSEQLVACSVQVSDMTQSKA